jgi:sugar phosphate isomerase/epimerase
MRFTVHGLFPPHKEKFWFNACEGLTKKNMDAMDTMLKAAELVSADVMGIHPGYPVQIQHSGGVWDSPKQLDVIPADKAVANALELIEFTLIAAEDAGIKLAVENAGLSGPGNFFLQPQNIKRLLDSHSELGFLLDIGHALYMGNLEGMLKLHERVAELHVHFSPPRSAAGTDRHLPIPEGFDLEQLRVIKQIKEIPLVFEHSSKISEPEILGEKQLLERLLQD